MMSRLRAAGFFHRLGIPSFGRAVLLSTIFIVLYNEFLCYLFCRWKWTDISSNDQNDLSELRILFVADAQLVGFRDERVGFLGSITRWDCDRYLRSGFYQAFDYVRPELIIFLGDLLDEGSRAADQDFAAYVNRFEAVFQTPQHVQKIFIPGDNDVGGEGFEPKEKWKVNRFQSHFQKSNESAVDFAHVKFVDFFKLSYDFGETLTSDFLESLSRLMQRSTASLRVVCNHMGILSRLSSQYNQLISVINPDLFITAHTHKAAIYHCANCRKNEKEEDPEESPYERWKGSITSIMDNNLFTFQLDGTSHLLELVVPTCSYRMGVDQIGYGAAVLDAGGNLRYTVLWLPARYFHLYFYAVYAGGVLSLVAVKILLCIVLRILGGRVGGDGGSKRLRLR